MRVTEAMTFDNYDADPRFGSKKPYRFGSRKQSCGDNIYFRCIGGHAWNQRDSFHSGFDGTPNLNHVAKDTGVDRVLVSNDFIYFGGYGPKFPDELRKFNGIDVCKSGIGYSCFDQQALIKAFVAWIRTLGDAGYQAAPYEWRSLRG